MVDKNTEQDKKRIAACQGMINAYLGGDSGRSQTKLALVIGINAGALSSFMRGMYVGDNHKLCDKIESFFQLENERRSGLIEPDFVLTRQAEKIKQFVVMAHAYNTMSVIFGDSGIGKTKTLKEYARQYPKNVHYIQCNPFMRSKFGFLQQLCLAANLPLGRQNIVSSFNRLATEGAARGALIILDDAQTLAGCRGANTTIFEVIRALHDQGVGFVICGNSSIRGDVTTTEHEELYQQFASRAKILQVSDKFTREDVADVIAAVLKNGALNEEEFDFLYRIANEFYGSLRLVINILSLAVSRAHARKAQFNVQYLRDAARHIVSGQKPEYKNQQKKGGMKNGKEETRNEIENENTTQGDKNDAGPVHRQTPAQCA